MDNDPLAKLSGTFIQVWLECQSGYDIGLWAVIEQIVKTSWECF